MRRSAESASGGAPGRRLFRIDLGDLGAFDGDAGHEALLVEEVHQDIVLGRGGRQRRAGALVVNHYVRRLADPPAVAVVEVALRLLVLEVYPVATVLDARLKTEGGGRRALVRQE